MRKSAVFVVGALITAVLAYVMFSDAEPQTRLSVSLILAAGVGVAAALMFGTKKL